MEKIWGINENAIKHLENIAKLANELQKEEKFSEEDAYYHAWYWYTYKGVKGTFTGARFMLNTKTAIQFIRTNNTGRAGQEIAAMPLIIEKFVGGGAREAYVALRGVTIAVLAVFSGAMDMFTIVSTWNPSIEKADYALQLLNKLENDYSRKINILSIWHKNCLVVPVRIIIILIMKLGQTKK